MEVKEQELSDHMKVDPKDETLDLEVKSECNLEDYSPVSSGKVKKRSKTLAYFICPHCDLKIVKSNFFIKHIENEHRGSQFLCSLCNLQFSTSLLFKEHVDIVHRNKGTKKKVVQAFYHCAFCDLKTVKSNFYVKHMSREHPVEQLQCSFCDLLFVTGEAFLIHVKSFHKKTKVKLSENVDVFPCHECKKIFSKLSNLDGHKRAVHNINVQVCEFCCKEFKNKDYCRQHIRLVHESETLDNVVCEVCSKVFKSKSNLYHHRRAVHEVAEDLICNVCAIKCKNSYQLRKHLRKCLTRAKKEPKTYVLGQEAHIQKDGQNFFCSDCNKTFFTPKALRSHNRAAHTFDPLICHICNRQCKNVDYLKQHYRRGHGVKDLDQINAMVRFVKPDYEPASNKKKTKEQDPDNPDIVKGFDSKPGFDLFLSRDCLKDTEKQQNSESQRQRQELVNKWREIEEEQNRLRDIETMFENSSNQLEATEFPFAKQSKSEDNAVYNHTETKDESFSYLNSLSVDKWEFNPEPVKNSEIKHETKDEDVMMLECEVKLEATGSEGFSDPDFDCSESSKEEEKVVDQFSCNDCNKTYSTLKYLTSHIRTVHTHEPCSCPHCNVSFKNSRYLSQHLQRAHKLSSKVAKEQSTLFSTGKGIIKEEATNQIEHDSQTEFPCSECSKTFSTKSRLSTHVSNMHVVGEFLCQLCGEKFTIKQQLKNHTEKVHSKADGVCQFCSKTFKNVNSHIKDVHMKEECICPHCAKTFHNKKHLNGHLAAVHPGEGQSRICPVCSKQFKNSQYLRQHVRLVHETVEDVTNYISCDECGKQFANKAHLYHHTKAVHVVESCNCTICGRTYKNKIALGKHMKHAHDGMVKNPYSGSVKSDSVQQEDSSQARAPNIHIPFPPRLDAFQRHHFSQPGWF